jgi:hypothetical protein
MLHSLVNRLLQLLNQLSRRQILRILKKKEIFKTSLTSILSWQREWLGSNRRESSKKWRTLWNRCKPTFTIPPRLKNNGTNCFLFLLPRLLSNILQTFTCEWSMHMFRSQSLITTLKLYLRWWTVSFATPQFTNNLLFSGRK